MKLGKVIYTLYYRPIAEIKTVFKQGLKAYAATRHGVRNMIAHSINLKEMCLNTDSPKFLVYFLTGKKYWYQTAFCLYSLQKSSNKAQFDAVFIDDGTLDDQLIEQIKRQFPSSTIRTQTEINKSVNEYLPYSKYPLLNKKREIYPHIRKLTDVHLASNGWKLVLDSDMLFFKSPDQIIDWLKNPNMPFFLHDPITSYHYSFGLMQNLTSQIVRQNLNVGIIGLKSESIDWQSLESWIKIMEDSEGASYYLEQALSAMVVAGQEIEIATPAAYIVLPNESETTKPSAVMHHYVAESKQWYLQKSWKLIV
jgi:hypothetical protein